MAYLRRIAEIGLRSTSLLTQTVKFNNRTEADIANGMFGFSKYGTRKSFTMDSDQYITQSPSIIKSVTLSPVVSEVIKPFDVINNYLAYSEQFDQSATWVPDNITVSPNTADTLDPFGGNNADKITDNTTSSKHKLTQITALDSFPSSYTIYVKAGTQTTGYIKTSQGTNYSYDTINLSNGTSGGGGSSAFTSTYNFTSVGNGWYRIKQSITTSTTTSGATCEIGFDNTPYIGTGTSFYIYGAQLTKTSVLPTYIKTTTTTSDISSLFNRNRKVIESISERIGYSEVSNWINFNTTSDTGFTSTLSQYTTGINPWGSPDNARLLDSINATATNITGITNFIRGNITDFSNFTGFIQTIYITVRWKSSTVNSEFFVMISNSDTSLTIQSDTSSFSAVANTYQTDVLAITVNDLASNILSIYNYIGGIAYDNINTPTISVDYIGVSFNKSNTLSAIGISLGRNRNLIESITETVAYTIDLSKLLLFKLFDFTIAEAESLTAAVSRSRNISLTQLEIESIATIALKRSRPESFSSNESETITDNIIRNRNNLFSMSETETIPSIPVKRIRSESFSMAELDALNASIIRTTRSLPFGISETYAITNALYRLKQESFSNSLVESISSIALKRNRTEIFTLAEAESIVAAASRIRSEVFSIIETIVITCSLGGPQKAMSFTMNEIESITIAAIMKRGMVFTDSLIEAIIITTVNRLRKENFTINETETITDSINRLRLTTTSINETETITSSLSRLKQITLTLAEVVGYSFTVTKLKALSYSVNEIDGFTFGGIRRTRNVIESLSEVINYGLSSITRQRNSSLSLSEIEVITEAINRARKMQELISELESITMPLSRKLILSTTISEIESVTTSLARLKLIAYIISQTESVSNIFLRRVRNAPFTVSEIESESGNFNRARALLLPVNETEVMTINFNRLRQQIISINETQGTEIAINRLRGLIQTIANTLDYTITLRVIPDTANPSSLTIMMEWEVWNNEFMSLLNSVYDVKNKSETFVLDVKTNNIIAFTPDATSSESNFSTSTESDIPFETVLPTTIVVVPNGIF